jgi:hypothetical protein
LAPVKICVPVPSLVSAPVELTEVSEMIPENVADPAVL